MVVAMKMRSKAAVALREARQRLKLPQTEAARRVGIDPIQYSKYETGLARPGRTNAAAIQTAFGIAVQWWDDVATSAARRAS